LLTVLHAVRLEGACVRVEIHLRVGTHIDRPFQQWLQILDVQAELVLIGPPCRLIQVLMKLPVVLVFNRQFLPPSAGLEEAPNSSPRQTIFTDLPDAPRKAINVSSILAA